ncbi:hypothetical protein TNCV_1824551 [Trichonephila clavipes]|nr:hypothetical protein TNCV_1824551 [Trichonephila clavipes]
MQCRFKLISGPGRRSTAPLALVDPKRNSWIQLSPAYLVPSGPVARYPSGQGIGSWLACHEFEPSTTKDPSCRAAMHVKSVESSNVLPLKNPEGSKLAKMVANDAKLAANLVVKYDANLSLSPRFRQVLIESPL